MDDSHHMRLWVAATAVMARHKAWLDIQISMTAVVIAGFFDIEALKRGSDVGELFSGRASS